MGCLHPVAMLHLVQHLGIGHARVGDPPVGDQLGQEDPKTPNITLYAEPAVVSSFWCCPLDRKPGSKR